jgi:hypothetical protein
VTYPDTFKPGETALLSAIGDSIVWYSDAAGTQFIGSGPVLLLDNLTDTTTVYAQNVIPIDGLDFQMGPVMHSGNTKYNATFVNGGLMFEVYKPIYLHQITLHTDSAGIRIIEIADGVDFFFAHEVELEAGTTVVDLEIEIPEGAYTLSTNTDQNNAEFGTNSPILWRSSSNVLYPYEIPGIVSITNSTFGMDFFYYFYDWKVSTADKYCLSNLVPATAFPDMETATDEKAKDDSRFVIAPNPTDGVFNIYIPHHASVDIEIYTLEGKSFFSGKEMPVVNSVVSLDLTHFPRSIYVVHIFLDGKYTTQKIVRL